jgi:hypothetical protein
VENNFIITEKQLQIILRYLFTKPYQEVATSIQILGALPKLDPKISPDFVKDEGKKNDTKN